MIFASQILILITYKNLLSVSKAKRTLHHIIKRFFHRGPQRKHRMTRRSTEDSLNSCITVLQDTKGSVTRDFSPGVRGKVSGGFSPETILSFKMKRIPALSLTGILINSCLFAQWTWLNPLPQGNTLTDIQFISETTGYAVGDGGTVLKTSDAGLTWERLNTNTISYLCGIHFITDEIGYACGINLDPGNYNTGIVIKTVNGGESWVRTPDNLLYAELYSVYFTSADTGYVAGFNWSYKTINGGATWFEIQPASAVYSKIYFTDSETGYLLKWGTIYKTQDAGSTWAPYPFPQFCPVSVSFVNKDTGYTGGYTIPGSIGKIYKTEDAGGLWTELPFTAEYKLLGICFVNADTGFAVGDSGLIIRTTDGGLTWTELPSGTSDWLGAIGFASAGTGVTIGPYGTTIRTIDSGETWQVLSSNVTRNHLLGLYFTNFETGYAVGCKGTILKTNNAGSTWELLPELTSKEFYDITFTDQNTGYACGEYGIIYKTINAGNTWDSLLTNTTQFLYRFEFIDSFTGFVRSDDILLKTTDAGLTWTSISLPQYFNASSFSFINEEIGYVGGDDKKLIKTVNGGNTWTFLNHSISGSIYAVYFLSAETGFISGDNKIFKTTDGGVSWAVQCEESGCNDFFFLDSLTGYGFSNVGYYTSNTALLYTTDGGESWGIQPINQTNYQLGEIFFTSVDTGYIVGLNGLILKTTCGGVITGANGNQVVPDTRAVLFPNPGTDHCTVLPGVPHPSALLILFDVNGKIRLKQRLNQSITRINTLSLPSGIYLYRITAGKEIIGSGKWIKQ
jgi:photosystem II stability/assembly factor-like uncharacterized protein